MNDLLITGGTGTVGSNFACGKKVSSKQYDLRDINDTARLIVNEKPKKIIHCAAKVGGISEHLSQRYKLFYDNLLINSNVIEVAKQERVERVLSFLSSCIFPEVENADESVIFNGNPHNVHLGYGHAKRSLLIQSQLVYEEYGLKYNCIIPCNIYGFYDDFNDYTAHCIGALIRKAHRCATEGGDFICFGDGKEKRNFVFVQDVCDISLWCLDNYLEKESLVLCPDELIEIGDIVKQIAEKFGVEKRVRFNNQSVGQRVRSLNGAKLNKLTEFKYIPFSQGLDKTISWFIENFPNVRL